MLTLGLVSITFRPLPPRAVTDLCVHAGLQSIEWGGDVHVPAGDLPKAREVAGLTSDAGLSVAAYGSYFRTIDRDGSLPDFDPIVATAAELGAPSIRVWAGTKDSDDISESEFQTLVVRLRSMAALAAEATIRVCLEFHGGTYTDTTASTLRLLDAVDHPNLDTLWQPPVGMPTQDCVESLRACLPRASNIHAFHWEPMRERQALATGTDRWLDYLRTLKQSDADRHVLIEFVKNDSPDQLVDDAATLRELCVEVFRTP